MGFIFQRRLNLGQGVGFNVSKSGISPSVRTKYGSMGSKGFSLRTGIPGFYYRKRWGVKSNGFLDFIVFGILFLFFFLTWEIISTLFLLIFNFIKWIILTLYDIIIYSLHSKKETNINQSRQDSNDEKSLINEFPVSEIQTEDTPFKYKKVLDYGNYLLIDELATPLVEIINLLKKDSKFIEYINEEGTYDNTVSIDMLIILDLKFIFETCTNKEKIDMDSIETFGFAFIGYKIYNPKLANDFDSIIDLLENDKNSYYHFCDILTNINSSKENIMPLLNYLKTYNHEQLQDYARSIYQYSVLIVKLDLNISQDEEKALKKIKSIIYSA